MTVGSCATGDREPGQDREVAAFSGTTRVPQTAWPSPPPSSVGVVTSGAMRFAVNIPPFTDAATVVDLAVDAETAGWDGVFLWDHLQFMAGAHLTIHDPWVLLGAMAVRTERVRLGTVVTPLSRRRPQMVAKHVTTLDHLSGGRAVLGVGLGSPADADFAAFGDEADDLKRAAILDDRLTAVAAMLAGGEATHHGKHTHIDADLLPASVQRPRPPIWVAAVAPHRRPLARAVPLGRRRADRSARRRHAAGCDRLLPPRCPASRTPGMSSRRGARASRRTTTPPSASRG